jgi:hypothetical protein
VKAINFPKRRRLFPSARRYEASSLMLDRFRSVIVTGAREEGVSFEQAFCPG